MFGQSDGLYRTLRAGSLRSSHKADRFRDRKNPMTDKRIIEEITASHLRQLDALHRQSEGFLKRRVTLWGIRWTIGFTVIWAVVAHQPAWHWLWWVGGAVALLSLAMILVGRGLLKHNLEQFRATAEVRTAAELAEDGEERDTGTT